MKICPFHSEAGVVALVGLLVLPMSAAAWSPCPGYAADDPAQVRSVFFSPFTHHFNHSDEHEPVVLLGFQRQLPKQRLCGISVFSNSFAQPSLYAFTGWKWPQLSQRHPRWYAKVTAGILYGYVEPYEDKVPLNQNGFSPAIIPALGYRLSDRSSAQVHVLGTAGLMFGLSFRY